MFYIGLHIEVILWAGREASWLNHTANVRQGVWKEEAWVIQTRAQEESKSTINYVHCVIDPL